MRDTVVLRFVYIHAETVAREVGVIRDEVAEITEEKLPIPGNQKYDGSRVLQFRKYDTSDTNKVSRTVVSVVGKTRRAL